MAAGGDVAARRAELIAKEEARQKDREAARQKAELELLEIVDKYETEIGPRGQRFQVIDATALGEGLIVLKLGEEVLWKRYTASKMTDADTFDFVFPCVVHPAKELFAEIVSRRGAIAGRCAKALGELYGLKFKEEEGKF